MKLLDIAEHLESAADALPDLVFTAEGELVSGKPAAERERLEPGTELDPKPTR